MSDRYLSLSVALDREYKDEDCQRIIEAIKMVRGVINVAPNISNLVDWNAESRIRRELEKKLWEVLYPRKTT